MSADLRGASASAEAALRASISAADWDSIELFRAFLRIRTVSAEGPVNGAYAAAVDLLRQRLEAGGVACSVKGARFVHASILSVHV
jgi:hypothetical protein